MKKKIALLLVMVLSLFCMFKGQDNTHVSADGGDIPPITAPTPRP